MNKEQGRTLKEILETMDEVTVRERRGCKLRFRMYLTRTMEETSIEALELGVRAFNSLKRAGYNTVGDVVEAVASGTDLRSIRNCGKTSVREIMEQLFVFQYYALRPERRQRYLAEVVLLNTAFAG